MPCRTQAISLAILLLLSLAGCARQQLPDFRGVAVELRDTPFFAQQRYQCGPAALATVLRASGVNVDPDTLVDQVYLPDRKGSLQPELLGAIRSNSRIPYIIRPEVSSLAAELQAGRPILVLQNLGFTLYPAYHYAVVIGVQEDGHIILRSGVTHRLSMEVGEFLKSWEKAGKWGVVVLRAEEYPAQARPNDYLSAIADLESTGNATLAERGYRNFLDRFPEQPTALFGLANSLYAQNLYQQAAEIYTTLLTNHPDHAAAANNLAQTYGELGCYTKAMAILDEFLQRYPEGSSAPPYLFETRAELRQHVAIYSSGKTICQDNI